MSLVLIASDRYVDDGDCMNSVSGAIVMMSPEPALPRSVCRAWLITSGLTPFSRSMSTPSKPNVCIRPKTLLAKLAAAVESPTETVPFWPPTEMITFLPRECSVATSALKSALVYPPTAADSPESTLNTTPPGLAGSVSAKATAIRSKSLDTSRSFSVAAPLLKFCQYPVSSCFGSGPPPGGGLGLPVGVGDGDGDFDGLGDGDGDFVGDGDPVVGPGVGPPPAPGIEKSSAK